MIVPVTLIKHELNVEIELIELDGDDLLWVVERETNTSLDKVSGNKLIKRNHRSS